MHEIAGQQTQAVNLQDLHERLESGHRFADWVKARIEKYGFVEGRDYVVVIIEANQRSPLSHPVGFPSKESTVNIG